MKVPRLVEVFCFKEDAALPNSVPVLKKSGPVQSHSLPDYMKWGIKDAMNHDGAWLPYHGKPPEGSFFFVQSPTGYDASPRICFHMGQSSGKYANYEWSFLDPNASHDDEDGESQGTMYVGTQTKKVTGSPMGPPPKNHGMWLQLDDSELEPWVKEKASQRVPHKN